MQYSVTVCATWIDSVASNGTRRSAEDGVLAWLPGQPPLSHQYPSSTSAASCHTKKRSSKRRTVQMPCSQISRLVFHIVAKEKSPCLAAACGSTHGSFASCSFRAAFFATKLTARSSACMDNLFRRTMSNRPSIEDILRSPRFPTDWPFSPSDFNRLDTSSDAYFYQQPRIGVFHIDDQAVRAITRHYANVLPPNAHILDLCSSWVSHLPDSYQPATLTALGMSQPELDANPRATATVVQDLNNNPSLPFPDNSFDVITNVVSVDYLTKPLQVFREMGRVLKPGGQAIMSFSNRCFPTKAIDIWCRTSDAEHVFIVGCYFHYSRAFEKPVARDLKPGWFGISDPMYVVEARALSPV